MQYHLRVLAHGIFRIGKRFQIEHVFARQIFFHFGKLFLQSAGQNEQTHNLYDAYAFLFDVVHTLFGVENSVGVLFVRAVVAQNKVEHVFAVVVAADRGDGVVLFVGAADDVGILVSPVEPGIQHALCHIVNAFAVASLHAHDGVVPIENANLHVGILHALIRPAVISRHHGQNFRAALIVVVRKYGAADDGKSRV